MYSATAAAPSIADPIGHFVLIKVHPEAPAAAMVFSLQALPIPRSDGASTPPPPHRCHHPALPGGPRRRRRRHAVRGGAQERQAHPPQARRRAPRRHPRPLQPGFRVRWLPSSSRGSWGSTSWAGGHGKVAGGGHDLSRRSGSAMRWRALGAGYRASLTLPCGAPG